MKRNNPLSSEARELSLYIENDSDLYRQQTTPIILNLARKIKRGIFSHVKAAKLFRYLADNGAKKYSTEFDVPQPGVTHSTWQRYKGFGAFSAKVRNETAKHLLRYYFQAIREKAVELRVKKNPTTVCGGKAYRVVLKGDKFKIARAMADAGIPFIFVAEAGANTVGDVPKQHIQKLGRYLIRHPGFEGRFARYEK